MSQFADIRIQGVPELQAAFDRVRDKFSTKEVKRVLRRAATPMKRAIKSAAPVGPTGNLRRSVKAKTLRGNPPAVRVGPDFRIAPHYHLVVRGTEERFRKRGKVQIGPFQFSIRGASTGAMPDNPFIEDAEKATIGQSEQIMLDGFKRLLDSVGK